MGKLVTSRVSSFVETSKFFGMFDAKDLGFFFVSGNTHYQLDDTFLCVLNCLDIKEN